MPEPPLCVGCRKQPMHQDYRPFCSERCRLIDLGRWIAEEYRVPDTESTPPPPDAPHGRHADDY